MTESFFLPARQKYAIAAQPLKRSLIEFYSKTPVQSAEKDLKPLNFNGQSYFRTLVDFAKKEDLQKVDQHIAEDELMSNLFRRYIESASQDRGPSKIVGVINCTPDSFYEGSRMLPLDEKVIDRILAEGPDVVDIGGESTRPGSTGITWQEELERIMPTLKYISETSSVQISIDTKHPEIIDALSDFKIDFVNDISGLVNPEMRRIVGKMGTKVVIMHMRGEPSNMQTFVNYNDIIAEIVEYFFNRIDLATKAGIKADQIILDPGIGFSKDLSGNLDILRYIDHMRIGFPLYVGASRKSFIGKITGDDADRRLPGTIATSIYLAKKKVDYIRVHDVRENKSAIKMYGQLDSDLV